MFYKKMYIIVAILLTISGGLLTLSILYGDFIHNSPVRAKQVISIQQDQGELAEKNYQYKLDNNAQTIKEVGL